MVIANFTFDMRCLVVGDIRNFCHHKILKIVQLNLTDVLPPTINSCITSFKQVSFAPRKAGGLSTSWVAEPLFSVCPLPLGAMIS